MHQHDSDEPLGLRELIERVSRLIMLGTYVCVAMFCVVVGFWYWQRETTLSNIQQEMVNQVLKYAYPNATMIRADGDILSAPVGSTVYIEIWVTFESPDSFDQIKAWYFQHSEGGSGGVDGQSFPKYGLEIVYDTSSDKTQYRVLKTKVTRCPDFLPACDRPVQKIR